MENIKAIKISVADALSAFPIYPLLSFLNSKVIFLLNIFVP